MQPEKKQTMCLPVACVAFAAVWAEIFKILLGIVLTADKEDGFLIADESVDERSFPTQWRA